jgi:N-acetylmuramoyl-L-alanine amidase
LQEFRLAIDFLLQNLGLTYINKLFMKKVLALGVVLFAFLALRAQDSPAAPFWVRTKGALPFLEYGVGDDRLGGAKMTYLDSNVLLKVVDSFATDYKVQLAGNFSAYIDKKSVMDLGAPPKVQPWVSASILVNGDSAFDYVAIQLPEKLPYRSQMQINPSRIVVDIFGVASNTNWITQRSTAKGIANTYYEQTSDDVLRMVIELKQPTHWGYQLYYNGNRLTVKVKRQPPVLSLRKLRIAVDAGHGGSNTGATGVATGIKEKDYTLLMAKELQRQLQKAGATVIMTREKDTALSMEERVLMLRQADPHLLISIHLNSSAKDSIKGVSTYYRYIGFRPLSQAILKNMLALGLAEFGNVGAFNFSLSGPTEYPNCLVEVAFLSNKEDEQRILDARFHKQVAKKIVAGIKDWLKEVD